MTRNDILTILEKIKTAEAYDLPHRLAPEINNIDLAVAYGLIRWSEVASILGVHRSTITRACRRARELFDEWKKTGVLDKLNNPAGASNVSNVRRDNNGGVERLQSGNNVLQSNQSPIDGSAGGGGMVDESKMQLIEAFRKSKSF